MKKIEVKIDALSIAKNSTGSHLIILTEGNRKLPIVINPNDAQFILVKINKLNITKPLTNDVFKTITDIYQIDIQEVYIYAYSEGCFYARIVTTNHNEVYEVECTVSTALSMSIVYNCPIFINEDIMDKESIISTEDSNVFPIKKETAKRLINSPKIRIEKIENIDTMDSLNKKLQEAVENEEFEIAVELRDRISRLKKK
jgi:bifunctional DNase/RNase